MKSVIININNCRLLAIALAAVIVFSIAACGGAGAVSSDEIKIGTFSDDTSFILGTGIYKKE